MATSPSATEASATMVAAASQHIASQSNNSRTLVDLNQARAESKMSRKSNGPASTVAAGVGKDERIYESDIIYPFELKAMDERSVKGASLSRSRSTNTFKDVEPDSRILNSTMSRSAKQESRVTRPQSQTRPTSVQR